METKQIRVYPRQWKELKNMSVRQGLPMAEILANLWHRLVNKDPDISDLFRPPYSEETVVYKGETEKKDTGVN